MVTVLLSRTAALINNVVMLNADIPLPAADIARAARVAYTPAVSALATLEKRGLVRRTRRAGRDEFEPERRSVYYPMAYATALVDLPLADALRGQRVYGVYVYGSLAQPGGGTRSSDLDLFIVGDVKDRAAVSEGLAALGKRLSRVIDPFILTPEQFELGKQHGDGYIASALGGVRVMGSI
jgi:hypothetical protein